MWILKEQLTAKCQNSVLNFVNCCLEKIKILSENWKTLFQIQENHQPCHAGYLLDKVFTLAEKLFQNRKTFFFLILGSQLPAFSLHHLQAIAEIY